MKVKVLSVVAAIIGVLASVSSASACGFFSYQPEMPKTMIR